MVLTESNNLRSIRYQLVIFAIVLLSCVGCETSNPDDAGKTPTVSVSAFGNGLDEIMNSSGATLLLISYWDGWQAILRDSKSKEYQAYKWDGSSFTKLSRSVLVRDDLCTEVYSHLEPLGEIHRLASIDYSQVHESTKSWKRINKTFLNLPVPSLMAINRKGHVRPIWILPYRMYPSEGLVGVLADDGEILKSIKLDRGGLRERHWME